MSKTYSAGIVTAYGAAKRAGYTGTYEDFCRQQAGYAENAAAVEQAKTDAINAKNDAVTAKNTAVSAKDDAVSAKNDAVSAKNTATTKAQEASQSATSAGQSATSAGQSATSAEASARASAQSADDAEQSAQSVSGSLAQIQTNKEDIDTLKADLADIYKAFPTDTASGDVAHFDDGADGIPVKSLAVDINPVQDLHGQDAPYPAGGGKNLLNASADSGSSNGVTYTKNENGTYTVNGTANSTSSFAVGSIELTANTQYILSGCPSGGGGSSYNVCIRDANYITLGIEIGNGVTITPTETKTYYCQITVASGYSVSNLVFKPMVCLSTASNPDYAHFAPYSNICPISGWTGCEVNATNKNLCGGSKLLANLQNYMPGGTTNTEEGYFHFSSGASTSSGYRISSGVPFKENTRYTFILTLYKSSGTGTNLRVYYKDGSTSVIPQVTSEGVKETVVYTSLNGKTVVGLHKYNGSGSTRIYYNESGIFEGVLTVDQFEQFGKYIPINWQTEAGTVYGGTLDVTNGVLTVDSVKETYNGTEAWIIRNNSSTSKYFTHQVGAYGDIAENDIICDAFKQTLITGNTQTIGINVVNSSGYNASFINLRPVGYMDMDVDAFKAWLAEHPITVVYGIANLIEIQLTPHEVNSLLGVNNIFADTGDTHAEYRADTALYISRLTEPDADMIADANITLGKYFMVGNNLYLATANIASGASVIVGINAIRKSLSEALNEINS